MDNNKLPAPKSALVGSVSKPSQSSTSVPVSLKTTKVVRSYSRTINRHPDLIEIGGGLIPGIKCNRKNFGVAVLAIGSLIVAYFLAKEGFHWLFKGKESSANQNNPEVPAPPKVESVVNCVNNAGEPKAPLIPDMVYEGGITLLAGRTNAGKTLGAQQMAIEIARGYGELVGENIQPQNVIIVDGEMDDDDYKRRFGSEDMEIPANITRISDCDFSTLKQLTEYLKKVVDGLLAPVVIIVDNLAALTLENLTGKIVNQFFRDIKKIQREAQHPVTFIIADHIGKIQMGSILDDSNIAGSANVARFAHNIIFVEFSARGPEYRFLKFTKQRKGALPDEVLEVRISEEEYTHFEIVGTASEADLICTKANLRRFNQEGGDDEPGEDEPEPEESGRGGRPWSDEDTRRLRELAETLETPYADIIAEMMGRNPVHLARKAKELGVVLMSKPRGRKPKPKDGDGQEQNQELE